jgi:hypothetical protein
MEVREMRPMIEVLRWGLVFAGLQLAATSGARPEDWGHPQTAARIEGEWGPLEIEIFPDGRRPLPLTLEGPDRWTYDGSTEDLVGESYSIRIVNGGRERIKVVVSVDGVNVIRKRPVTGRADADAGWILEPRWDTFLRGWQVDLETAERFVFSPPEFSEGAEAPGGRVGVITVDVYREWRPVVMEHDAWGGLKQRSNAAPPIGTTSGDDVENNVRVVEFVARNPWPDARGEIVYGRPHGRARGALLGVRVLEEREGLRVTDVVAGSIADDAGLRRGDLVTKIDTIPRPGLRDLRSVMASKRPGDYLFLRARRGPHQVEWKIRM